MVELILAELGPDPAQDLLFRLHFDGGFQVQSGGVLVAASQPEAESAGQTLADRRPLAGQDQTASEVADILRQAWWCQVQNKWLAEPLPRCQRHAPGGLARSGQGQDRRKSAGSRGTAPAPPVTSRA